jgi:CheY-like chemotaxis protein
VREITADFLRDEVFRLGAVISQTKIFHPTGIKLHSIGDVITHAHAKRMLDLGIPSVHLLEPNEEERVAWRTLGVERVKKEELAIGDEIVEDVRGPAMELLAASGRKVDAAIADKARGSAVPLVTIRRRNMETAVKPAQDYIAQTAPPPLPFHKPDTRMTRVTSVGTIMARPLFVPRARVLVAVPDGLFRSIVANTLAAAGHEAVEHGSVADAIAIAQETHPDVIVVEGADAPAFCGALRSSEEFRTVSVIACIEAEKPADVYRALAAGANDTVAKPPRRDILLDKIRGCMAIQGKKVRLAPFVQKERRKGSRPAGGGECGLADPEMPKSLPFSRADAVDLGESGVRLEYNMPSWPNRWAYVPHGIHPKHFFYAYAASNPLGRSLLLTLPGPDGKPRTVSARAVHVAPRLEFEALGLAFKEPARA